MAAWKAPRVMLHAAALGFAHPLTGEGLHVESPLPEDFRRALRRLRRAGRADRVRKA